MLMVAWACVSEAALPPPPTYVCQRSTESITVDGRGEEKAWQSAMRLHALRDIEGAGIPDNTEVRMLWDDSYLYVLADMKEAHLWATLKQRDSVIFRDPDFEVFIDPDGDGLNYIEIEINAYNTVWDLFLPTPYRHSNLALHDWNIPGLKHAVHLRGTLNNPADQDEGWSVEMAIPWKSITGHANQPRSAEPPAAGTTMRMNFSRVNWHVQPDATTACGYAKCRGADGKPLPEMNHVWAPTGIVNIHYPECWGYVRLSANPVGSGFESMALPATEPTQRRLFAYYNAQLEHRAKQGFFSASLKQPGVRTPYVAPRYFVAQTTASDGRVLSLDSQGYYSASTDTQQRPPLYVWVQGNKHQGDVAWWQRHFASLAGAGIHAVVIGGDRAQVAMLTPPARQCGLQVYAWMWALNRPGDANALQHADWYVVNRRGVSAHARENRPYVDYYQFLCPNHPEVLAHLQREVDTWAAIPGLSGIQLDYLRLPDVILPRGLWEKYGLEMHQELPEFDYCYCPRCMAAFEAQYGRAIREPAEQDAQWREFRLQSVARVANALCRRIRSHHLRAACAVFPTPQLAASLVRQDWARFELDLALPMVYYSFYQEPARWAADASRAAMLQTGRRLPLAPGLHLPDVSAESLPQQLECLRATSPAGIGLFCDDDLSPAKLDAIRRWCK